MSKPDPKLLALCPLSPAAVDLGLQMAESELILSGKPNSAHVIAETARHISGLRSQRDALLTACKDAVEELRTDENYVGENGGEAEFLVNLRAAIERAEGRS